MQLNNWKLFDKHGSPLNWYADDYLRLNFVGDVSSASAAGYLITDPSGIVTDAEITNSGFYYYDPTSINYDYVFGEKGVDISSDVSIVYTDVSIFNPDPVNTQGIGSLEDIDVSGNFLYPSTVYSSALFLKPVSQGLVETEHLYILEDFGNDVVGRPFDPSTSSLVFRMLGDEDEIKFFTVDADLEDITWTDELVFDVSTYSVSTPLTINVGFRSDTEGVFERSIRIYNVIDGIYYTMGEIVVNAEAIGEDERFRTLLGNFGLPDPKDFPHMFKEADINEALPDYEIINPKSKYMILEHAEITPYIGTYKALINALKWLGYDDIYVREWFKNVKENKKLSLIVPYEARDRTKTILMFSPDERRALKKLNQLSLNYCITKETGTIDAWGTPETENCYEYNIEELFIKLVALKNWLEKNIIGVNARIIDITGEGVYFERYINLIWSTDNMEYDYSGYQTLTPETTPDFSELTTGEASINMTLKEYALTTIGTQKTKISDYINYVWDPITGESLSPSDPSYLADPDHYLEVGAPLSHPFVEINDIQWKATVSKTDSGVLTSTHVTNPLWIYENQIKFYNLFDTSTVFYDTSINLGIILEEGYIRDASSNDWPGSAAYHIYPETDPSLAGGYILESSTGEIYRYDDYVWLSDNSVGSGSLLQYAFDETYRVPLLSFKNFRTIDASNIVHTFDTDKLYHLDILDGKIFMDNLDPSTAEPVDDVRSYINFHYDTSSLEQNIELNIEYISPRMPLYVIDPSEYYWADPSGLTGGDSLLALDNSIYTMNVNYSGDYNIEVFAWDGYNILYSNHIREPHDVYVKSPTIYTITSHYSDVSITELDVSTLLFENNLPIYEREVPYLGLSLEEDASGNNYISIPSITYFQDVPQPGTIDKFYLASEQISNISGSNVDIVKLYEEFSTNDDVVLIKTYKGSYMAVDEATTFITSGGPTTYTLDSIPSDFILDGSHNIYIHNVTERSTSDPSNNLAAVTFSLDVSNYTFLDNQLVNLIVKDLSTGYQWGSSYRVIDVSNATHTFDMNFPEFIVNDPSRYDIKARHAYASFANYELDVSAGSETSNIFEIYHNKDYREYFLDNTFVMMNILFDQEYANDNWYDSSLGLDSSIYYYHELAVDVPVGELLILNSLYDPCTYLLDQNNIWTIKENISQDVVFRVFNKSVPFVFDTSGYYDVIAESYDSYGNLASRTYPGLIHVV